MAGRHSNALNTAPLIAHRLGLQPTAICTRVDTLCAGSNTGIILAKGLVESGMAQAVLVAGGREGLHAPALGDQLHAAHGQ